MVQNETEPQRTMFFCFVTEARVTDTLEIMDEKNVILC